MIAPTELRFVDGGASWSRTGDGVEFIAQGRDGPVTVLVTRAGLAAFEGKDSSEISAGTASSLFEDHKVAIQRITLAQYARAPGSSIRIDYMHVEPMR